LLSHRFFGEIKLKKAPSSDGDFFDIFFSIVYVEITLKKLQGDWENDHGDTIHVANHLANFNENKEKDFEIFEHESYFSIEEFHLSKNSPVIIWKWEVCEYFELTSTWIRVRVNT
jgi:hypothetical protein